MYISELDLHGFKSFAHKTKVKFDKGITAIVGPNGCGKSNIVDALRWVLGEQRPTLLRSTSMSNVIFNGTSSKKAQGMAEVSLTLVNNRGLLPTEYNEINITRRLYRSGDSEYLINDTQCRLKDIMDLFMDTGMGADAYSVIELKMVEEILNDRNNDRRRLFEEAAGVTRYKEKRKQTFRKLDETRKDLQRVEDILIEVRKKVRSLESQAEKAEKARSIRKELTSLDQAYNRYLFSKIEEELEPLQQRISNAAEEKQEIEGGLEKLETGEEKARQALLEKERQESEKRRRKVQVENSIRELETGLRIAREKISNEKGVIRQYESDIEQSNKDLEELKELYARSRKKLEAFDQDLEKSDKSLKESKEKFAEVQQQYTRLRHQIYELEIESGETSGKLNDLKTEEIRLESRLENTEDDLTRISAGVNEAEKMIRNLDQEADEAEQKLTSLNEKKSREKQVLKEAEETLQRLEEERENLREEIRKLMSRNDAIESELRLIRDLADSKEWFPAGVAYLKEHHAGSFGRLEVVGSVLHTEEAHAPALEAALGEAINYLIVDSMEAAVKAASILKQEEQGRVMFIPLDELRNEQESRKHSILNVVDVDAGYEKVAELLLGSVLFAESRAQARRLLDGGGSAAVTPEGELITRERFYRSGSRSNQAGARLGLRDKIEKLEETLESCTESLMQKKRNAGKLESRRKELDLESLRSSLEKLEEEIQQVERQKSRIESGKQVYRKQIEEFEERKKTVSDSEDSARVELEQLKPQQKELKETLEELNRKQAEKKEQLQKLEEERSIAQNRYNDARLSHQDVNNKVENLRKEVDRTESGITSVEKRLKSRHELTDQSSEKIEELEKTIDNHEKKLVKLREEEKEAVRELKEAEEASSLQRGEIQELEKELKTLRQRKEVNLELNHHLSMAREKLEMQAESVSDHIWETYGLLMKQVDKELPEGLDEKEAKKRIGELRQKLNRIGDVNPLAIEEFEEEKERLEFLEEQTEDLVKAEEQLIETIEEINEVATETFNETFEKIRENFKTVFETLFQEGDHCDLVIEEDSEDPLEAKIEIKANPRGKRPSGINQLSGGEKTLTAIALLFAIYLVKPSPFCVLDEVDAPLDDANIERFSKMIRNFSEQTQFILITHNKKTMSKAEMMYGVTMPETGVSRLVGVQLDEVTT